MIKKLSPKELKAGMIAIEPIVTPLGQPIAPAGEELTRQIINKMKLYNCEYAVVDVEEEPTEAPTPVPAEPAVPKEAKTRVEEVKTHSQKIVASEEFHDFGRSPDLRFGYSLRAQRRADRPAQGRIRIH